MPGEEPFEWVDDNQLRSVKDVFDQIKKAQADALGINMTEDEIPAPVNHTGKTLEGVYYADGWGELRNPDEPVEWIASSAGFVNLGDWE